MKKFKYTSRDGTKFRCESEALTGHIEVGNASYNPERFAAAVAEMIAIHAMEIHPRLNGFAGYDTLTFKMV